MYSLSLRTKYGRHNGEMQKDITDKNIRTITTLDAGEVITEVNVSYTKYVRSLAFLSSSTRTLGPYTTGHAELCWSST
jgi:hypothetical protein